MIDPNQPIQVGELAASEAAGLRVRADILTAKVAAIKALDVQREALVREHTLLINEQSNFTTSLLARRGLDIADEYRLDPQNGTILLVAKAAVPPAEVAAAVEAEADAEKAAALPNGHAKPKGRRLHSVSKQAAEAPVAPPEAPIS